eukprot:4333764-Alexandrium_andersonii.AAC.2
MSASLVGSEMCIRDSSLAEAGGEAQRSAPPCRRPRHGGAQGPIGDTQAKPLGLWRKQIKGQGDVRLVGVGSSGMRKARARLRAYGLGLSSVQSASRVGLFISCANARNRIGAPLGLFNVGKEWRMADRPRKQEWLKVRVAFLLLIRTS